MVDVASVQPEPALGATAQVCPAKARRGRALDLAGREIGELTVLHRVEHDGPAVRWLCKCACGRYATRTGIGLRLAARQNRSPCCSVCLKELRGGMAIASQTARIERFRLQWEETGTLYSHAQITRLVEDVRDEFQTAFGERPVADPVAPEELDCTIYYVQFGRKKLPDAPPERELTEQERAEQLRLEEAKRIERRAEAQRRKAQEEWAYRVEREARGEFDSLAEAQAAAAKLRADINRLFAEARERDIASGAVIRFEKTTASHLRKKEMAELVRAVREAEHEAKRAKAREDQERKAEAERKRQATTEDRRALRKAEYEAAQKRAAEREEATRQAALKRQAEREARRQAAQKPPRDPVPRVDRQARQEAAWAMATWSKPTTAEEELATRCLDTDAGTELFCDASCGCSSRAPRVFACQLCVTSFPYCPLHAGEAKVRALAHLLCAHPERVPLTIAEILATPKLLQAYEAIAKEAPRAWSRFLGILEVTKRIETEKGTGR